MSASAHSPDEPNRRALYTFGSAHFLKDLVTAGLVPALVVMYKGALHLNYIHSTLIVFVSYLTCSISQPLLGWPPTEPHGSGSCPSECCCPSAACL